MKAIVMAGGRGSRLKLSCEKPLTPLCNKPMIEWVIETLLNISRLRKVYVALTEYTPNTRKWCRNKGIEVIETKGRGLPYDIVEAVDKVGGEALTVMADLPLITPTTIECIIEVYYDLVTHRSIKPKVLTVLTPIYDFSKLSSPLSLVPYPLYDTMFQPTGLSVFNLKGEGEVPVIAGFKHDFINVNTVDELKVVSRILCGRSMEEMYG